MTASYLRLPRPTLWLVRGDRFAMGDEAPFEVDVASFYISKAPVTNEEYEAFDPQHRRARTSAGDRDPVVDVSFTDAVGYCRWYAEASGKPFRLPSEAEWEFACRAGTETRTFWSDEDSGSYCWSRDNSDERCHEVETRRANAFGLHDMLGNVWEWTGSLHLPYPIVAGDDRERLDSPDPRSIRGGSFRTPPLGSAARGSLEPAERRDDVGFRIVRSLG